MKKKTFKFFKYSIFNKEKKDFIFWGILNLVFTNILLQILLSYGAIKISTFISQIFNITFGKFFFYLLLAFFSWNFNWVFILKLYNLGFNKNFSAIIVAPLLAINSYLIQKYFIFRK